MGLLDANEWVLEVWDIATLKNYAAYLEDGLPFSKWLGSPPIYIYL